MNLPKSNRKGQVKWCKSVEEKRKAKAKRQSAKRHRAQRMKKNAKQAEKRIGELAASWRPDYSEGPSVEERIEELAASWRPNYTEEGEP